MTQNFVPNTNKNIDLACERVIKGARNEEWFNQSTLTTFAGITILVDSFDASTGID